MSDIESKNLAADAPVTKQPWQTPDFETLAVGETANNGLIAPGDGTAPRWVTARALSLYSSALTGGIAIGACTALFSRPRGRRRWPTAWHMVEGPGLTVGR